MKKTEKMGLTSRNAKEFKETAISVALKSGRLLKEFLDKSPKIGFKGEIDLVTEADLRSEKLIIGEISKKFPGHDFLAEEGSEKKSKSRYLWLIDPLDGTTNYAHQFPIFVVSIALAIEGEIHLGIVYDPNLDELFLAEKGRGAFLNNRPIMVSKTKELNRSLLATGFPYSVRHQADQLFDYFRAFYLKTQGVRRCGAAALDLSYVACGRIDGFWEAGLRPWDTAAGSLILQEAGGTLSRFDGKNFDIYYPEVVASNSLIHQQILQMLKQTKRASKRKS